ncbi:MAG: hypothetical protein E2O37_04560 [Proteobacteria bacterium]|nr:MAG: hypothetical protein E2O37_04560 [Pseudomonadota bacterium]TDJ72682.1 MAG: hypothetical protein E2O38_03665 [Pseudomonadota bacterium]
MNMQIFKGMSLTSFIVAGLFSVFLVLASGFEKGLIYTIEWHILYFPVPFFLSMVILVLRWLLTRALTIDVFIKNLICGFVLGMASLVLYDVAFGSRGLQGFLFSPFSGLFGALVGGTFWFVVEREAPDKRSPEDGG